MNFIPENNWSEIDFISFDVERSVKAQIHKVDKSIEYFEWLLEQANSGESVRQYEIQNGKPFTKKQAAAMQAEHQKIARDKIIEHRLNREQIPKLVEHIKTNLELLNYKLWNFKPDGLPVQNTTSAASRVS